MVISESALKYEGVSTATLEDVARKAGVSPATVSRCLNYPDRVRHDKRRRVMEAIKALDYVPHGAARALASRHSRMIGAIFPAVDNALFGSALEVFQKRMADAGYTVAVASSGYDTRLEERHVHNMLQSGIDALVMVGVERRAEVYDVIQRRGIPYAVLWRSAKGSLHPCIGFDNVQAAENLTDYLVGLDHREFAVFSGLLEDNDRASDRLEGVRRGLAKVGVTLRPELLFERPFGVDEGREMFRLAMTSGVTPTAIVCGSEPFAYGAIFEAMDMGVGIPRDVSIAGFDNLWLARQMTPSLTTVSTPHRDIGEEAAKYLLARLAGRRTSQPRPLETSLIIRNSTGPCRAQ